MKKLVFILVILFYSCNTNSKVKEDQVLVDTISRDIQNTDSINKADSLNYEVFKSFFPDLILGKANQTGHKLPYNSLISEYFEYKLTPEEIEAGAKLELHSIGKIIGYKGFDLYVIEDVSTRPDEDSYDNHVENSQFIMLFKNNKSILSDDKESKLTYSYNSEYWGEGGSSSYHSYFDKDTTLVTVESSRASESATGYVTSINSDKEYRRQITEEGKLKLIEITKMEFSSDFYTQSFIDKNKYLDEDDSDRNFPTEKNKETIDYNPIDFSEDKIFINCDFYYKKVDGVLRIIFESMNANNEILDTYIVSRPHNSNIDKIKPYKYLKCPVIIKTSDGDLEILPNGRFHLSK